MNSMDLGQQDGSTLSGGALVGRVLAEAGVRAVFGVVGSGNFVATDALVKGGAHFYAARHEAGASLMADGYFRTSGEVAVCSVHQGPGFTNAMTSLAEAAKSRSSMVVIAGATSPGMARSNFHIDQEALARAAGAIPMTLHRPETITEDILRAYRRTVSEQLPVVLNMPLSVQAASVQVPEGKLHVPAWEGKARPSVAAVEALVDRLVTAKRPVFIGGRGAWRSGAQRNLERLAESVGAMLANTAVVKGLFTGHPRDVGIAGGFSTELATGVLNDADLIVGFGCSLTPWTTRNNSILEDGTIVVQVDSDLAALALNARVDLGILGDVDLVVEDVLREIARRDVTGASRWRSEFPSKSPVESAPVEVGVGDLHPAELTSALEKLLPIERAVVIDGGHFIGWPTTGLSVPDPSAFVFSSAGFQSIGLGLGMAIGAAIARPERLTVLVAGDGGFLMSVAELETLVRLEVPLLVIVYNDAAYGAEVHHFAGGGNGLELVQFPPTDLAALARGIGAQGTTVRSLTDLRAMENWLADPQGPFIVDAKISPDIIGFWAAQDFIGH